MIGEARSALMLQRVSKGADCITPREVLEMGTLGGAKVLGMDDYIGSIETGKSADFVFFRIDTLEMAGGISDPVSALILCNPGTVFMSVINGVIRIKEGEVIEDNFNVLIRNQNAMLEAILKKEL